MPKKNNNNLTTKNYYIGLDVGSESAGWAATDFQYNVLKFHGKHMWGARLFSEAQTAEGRRLNRTTRRRLARRKQRLEWLEMLFAPFIEPIDPNFFIRLKDSYFWLEDKTDKSCKYSLFNDKDYKDKDFYKEYPTIYHLRSELVHSTEKHDPRLVYLALHQLMKRRGHFLFTSSDTSDGKTLKEAINDLSLHAEENFFIEFKPANEKKFEDCLYEAKTITEKKSDLEEAYGYTKDFENDESEVSLKYLIHLLSGAKISFKDLFKDESLKDTELTGISLNDDLDEKYDQMVSSIGDERTGLIEYAKIVYDLGRLKEVLGNEQYLCDAKVETFKKNKKDLQLLKKYVKENSPDKYDKIFNDKDEKFNYVIYSKYHKSHGNCTQEEFCDFLKKLLPNMKDSENTEYQQMYKEIEEKNFLPKLRSKSNSVVPYQIQYKEVVKILENASKYLPLNEKDENGLTVKEKVQSLFKFRIPYYVGPLNKTSEHSWIERGNDKIYPWNFEDVVDTEACANEFMNRLIGRCTYTGDPVLPLNSLIYEKYMVLNEINPIQIDGKPIPVELKQMIFHDLFEENSKKVTKKSLLKYLKANGHPIKDDSIISGIDNDIKSTLKSYHNFKNILNKTNDTNQVEEIIQRILVFGQDKKKLKSWLEKNTQKLDQNDIKSILRLNYKDWGRLSKTFLTELLIPNENGEALNVMDMLWNTNMNLMQILNYSSDENYPNIQQIAYEYKKEKYGCRESLREQLEDMYIAPAVKRSIWQTLRIVDELVDIEKGAPSKIFIEMARTSSLEMKGKRTESRKTKLLDLYKSCKDQATLYDDLKSRNEQELRRDRLYLYYTQLGKCMYTGETIDLSKLLDTNDKTYDIDHIFPKSKIKDDSLDNRVLVKSVFNREKTNVYPISEDIRTKMHAFWSMLHSKKLISDKKYERLTRNSELTEDELHDFVARQITVTQQSTKALAAVLQSLYPNTTIVYSKAGNVSDFRHKYDFLKYRDINDQHHAKDAYLNIVVGNVYDTKFTKQFFKNIKFENYSLNKVFDFDTENAWVAKGENKTLSTVAKFMKKNDPIVTFTTYAQKGGISDATLMKKGLGQLRIKENLDIVKYGGYNKIVGTYYTIVEYETKKGIERSIFPVYLYKESEFDKNPETYCKEILKLINPKVIVKKVLNNALFELNGNRLIITGRTNNNFVYKHAYQFAIDDESANYLKYCDKYLLLCMKENKVVTPSEKDMVSNERNVQIYDLFTDRLSKKPYGDLFRALSNDLEINRSKFIKLNTKEQCTLLLNILHAFKCDRVLTDISLLNGKKSAGMISKNSVISKLDSAFLVNQSPTGLYETKIDLLKDK